MLGRLGALAGPLRPALPTPRLLPALRFGELRYAYLDGVTGDVVIEAGLAPRVLGEMGAFLRRLHALDPEPLADVLPGEGQVIAHGDFAHYNVLVDPAAGALVAVLDWEEARRGDPALDIAWCEAQFLARYPHLRGTLRHLYEAYGDVPDRARREHALEQRMTELRERAAALVDAGTSRDAGSPILYRCAFADGMEAAAFVAALSRFLASPAGAAYRAPSAEVLVWADAANPEGRDVYLAEAAMRATAERFGTPPAEPVELAQVPTTCVVLYGPGVAPAWGAVEARGRLTNRRG
ncbi:MAG TPA: phosphotransferase [Gemmatimonadaceae bacterium]